VTTIWLKNTIKKNDAASSSETSVLIFQTTLHYISHYIFHNHHCVKFRSLTLTVSMYKQEYLLYMTQRHVYWHVEENIYGLDSVSWEREFRVTQFSRSTLEFTKGQRHGFWNAFHFHHTPQQLYDCSLCASKGWKTSRPSPLTSRLCSVQEQTVVRPFGKVIMLFFKASPLEQYINGIKTKYHVYSRHRNTPAVKYFMLYIAS
jgi:hypothetical protein